MGGASSMRREQRLRRKADFEAVYRRGKAVSNQLLVLRSLSNDMDTTRFGFAVSKVVGGAVTRNRVRRRLREIVSALPPQGGLDVVIGARKAAAGAEFDALRRAYASLARRAGVVPAEAVPGEL